MQAISRPARGRLRCVLLRTHCQNISIHAPREGGDEKIDCPYSGLIEFQSTPPARGATYEAVVGMSESGISIHAPREGGDDGR